MASIILLEHFRELPDPRIDRTKFHSLVDLVAITVCATVSGCNSVPEVWTYARAKHDWLKTFLELPAGIPCESTFRRIYAALDPDAFQQCFLSWVQAVSQTVEGVVAIDGKTLRRAYDTARSAPALHMVSAWATQHHLVLGQVKTADKSNEITAIPELLKVLDLHGCLVTIDAMGCQTAIAQQIVDGGADYLLAVKDNQETLAQDIREEFQAAQADGFAHLTHTYHRTVEKGHGRIEERECWVSSDVEGLDPQGRWTGLKAMAMCRNRRTVKGETSQETRYYITSLSDATAETILAAVRSHWGIENSLHWVLDMAFREDDSRVRVGHGAHNLAIVRHWALNLLRQDRVTKGSIQTKRLKAGWDNDYLVKLLTMPHY